MALFAEIWDMRKLEQEWAQSDWGTALSSILMGRADQPGSGDAALAPLAEVLGIKDPSDARRRLFGRQAAVALPSWADMADGVVLARPDDVQPIENALAARKIAQERIGRVRQYQLDAHGHYLATDGWVILLGRRAGPSSPYERAMQLLAGMPGASLAQEEQFRNEVAALGSGNRRALLYFAPPTPPPASRPVVATASTSGPATTRAATASAPFLPLASRPATQPTRATMHRWWPASWPTLMRGAVGLSAEGPAIAIDIRGQLDRPAPPHLRDANLAVLKVLPETTLAAWAQSIDYLSHYRSMAGGSPSVLSLYLAFVDARMRAANTSLADGLLAHLGQETIVLLGRIPAADQTVKAGFDLAAVGMIIPTTGSAAAKRGLDLVGESAVAIVSFPGVRPKLKEPVQITQSAFEGTTIAELNLGEFFRTQSDCPYAHTIGLSWAVTDRDIILSTHSDHIRQILRARSGRGGTLGSRMEAVGPLHGGPAGADAVLLAQPAAAAAMLDGWIAYLAKHHPAVLAPEWWKARLSQQSGRVSLGFGMTSTRPTDVIVHNTLPGWPAHGRLLPGDRILKVNGTALDAENPRASLKRLLAGRGKGNEVVLTVLRSEKTLDVPIALPEEPATFDPIGAVRQISKLLQPFATASYTVRCTLPDRFSARVVLRAAPHATTTRTTAPASAPATATAATRPATQTASVPASPPPPVVPVATQPATSAVTTAPTHP